MKNIEFYSEPIKLSLFALLSELQTLLSKDDFDRLSQKLPTNLKSLLPTLSANDELLLEARKLALGNTPKMQNHSQLMAMFEQISLKNKINTNLQYAYASQPLSPSSIFPEESIKNVEWQEGFVKGIDAIPTAHAQNLPLWLDHFDTLLQCYTTNIPSQYDATISFYDFAKITSAFYVALTLADKQNSQPILLVQGDFFGIQDFIFSGGRETNKQAAKLLRGRSFQVSLFTELASLKLLERCGLPATSQVMNAAGKFLIITPNTEQVKNAIQQVQTELNQWFIQNTYGLAGLGIALKEASPEQFMDKDKFVALRKSLFEQLEETKLQRLDLTQHTESVQEVDYSKGNCELNNYFPVYKENRSLISSDQVKIGELLAKKDRIIVCDYDSNIYQNNDTQSLEMNIFGYSIFFTNEQESTGDFGKLAKNHKIHRFWDFSLAQNTQQEIWNGYARRYINAYIPYFKETDKYEPEKYNVAEGKINFYQPKTFDYIACEDRRFNPSKNQYEGQVALMTLKGDIDNLGTIFQKGLSVPNFAKMAALSRQMNLFFSLWLPAFCAEKYPNAYTVFAGGDDFFLIGSWYNIQQLATDMQQAFTKYVADNEEIHFSIGMVMTKLGVPVPRLGELAEEALEKAKFIDEKEEYSNKKDVEKKNAVTIYQRSVKWSEWKDLLKIEGDITNLAEKYNISSAYLYSLIQFTEQARNSNKQIENTMWRSRFYYKTARYITDKLKSEEREYALKQIIESIGHLGIEKYKENFAIPLFNYFYQKRH